VIEEIVITTVETTEGMREDREDNMIMIGKEVSESIMIITRKRDQSLMKSKSRYKKYSLQSSLTSLLIVDLEANLHQISSNNRNILKD